MAACDVHDGQWPLLWAKTPRDKSNRRSADGRYHPLLYHMLDVAAVAGLVWDQCLFPQLRKRLESSLGADARAQIVFLAGAHDVGKASPGFQKKVPELAQHSELRFSENDRTRPHGFISAHVLRETLGSGSATAVLAQIDGGHHGVFPRAADLRMGRDTLGNEAWSAARQDLLREFANTVGFDLNRWGASSSEIADPALVPLLAGFVSVADWIGSNQDYFPCAAQCGVGGVPMSVDPYWRKAQNQAQEALDKLGWLPSVRFASAAPFDAVFRGFTPNDLQRVTMELASSQTWPYLMIVEAPTGQGKTEAALYAADVALCRGLARGMYIAMPTQATSDAMFKRVLDDYLRRRGHGGRLNLQLVHGDALLAQMPEVREGEISEFKPESIGDEGDVEAQSWFTARKRPLLAPFGVGTIDQSLLSVLQTKHWFVRLFGLAGKVVIFDEVHAYDAYMSTILERLLHWLAEVDCTAILLSATLPEAKRRALARAYSGRDGGEYKRYPRITVAGPRHYPHPQAGSPPECRELAMEKREPISLRFAGTDLAALSDTLSGRLTHGGCAAVICNTVDRSIEVYEHLRDSLKDTECLLFHARTLRMWRRAREEEVLRKFGKRDQQQKDSHGHFINADRPLRAVLVATQVIEQSLDLDFDLMISEMAPVDLLLQRCGRLHRHRRQRPAGLETPELIVLCDAGASDLPPESFGNNIEFVYDRYVLLRTWLIVRGRERLEVPRETEQLIEAVYGESALDCDDAWNAALHEARVRMNHDCTESEKAASRLLVGHPKSASDLVEEFNDQLADEEDPRVHKTVRAATRQGDPSITVVMLPADALLTPHPDAPEVRALLDQSVKLRHRGVFHSLLERGQSPEEWGKNAHLRYARLIRVDERNQGRVGEYMLTLDEGLGVVIERDGYGHD
jgi:CRISPR-associated endonuclease/helicase Cas3